MANQKAVSKALTKFLYVLPIRVLMFPETHRADKEEGAGKVDEEELPEVEEEAKPEAEGEEGGKDDAPEEDDGDDEEEEAGAAKGKAAPAAGAAAAAGAKGDDPTKQPRPVISDEVLLAQLMAAKAGCVVAELRAEDAAALGLSLAGSGGNAGALAAAAPLALSAWKGKASLAIMVDRSECAQMADKIVSWADS